MSSSSSSSPTVKCSFCGLEYKRDQFWTDSVPCPRCKYSLKSPVEIMQRAAQAAAAQAALQQQQQQQQHQQQTPNLQAAAATAHGQPQFPGMPPPPQHGHHVGGAHPHQHMLELQQHLNLKHLKPPDAATNLIFNHMQAFQNGVQQQVY